MEKTVGPFTRGVLQTLHRYQLLTEGDHTLVALSGGPDSVALLLVLQELRDRLSLELSAAHLNHQLRGEESEQDEQFVQDLCRKLAIPIEVRRVDTRQAVRESGENLESCARRLRYDFLFEVAGRQESRVATGHTLNDQAETFLMKLVRGSGPAGLSGISPLRVNWMGTPGTSLSVTVVRPLLGTLRQDVLDYLEDQNQTYRIDSSNQDLSRDRNWVRHRLIPLLQERLNPALLETLQRSTELFGEVEEFLGRQGKEAFNRCRSGGDQETRLRISGLEDLPAIIAKEVIRRAIATSKGDLRDISLKHVEEVLQLSRITSGKEIHLPGGLRVQREFEELRFTLEPSPGPFSYPLKVPGEIYIKETSKCVEARTGHRRKEKKGEREPEKEGQGNRAETVWIKWSGKSLTVRSRRPGDMYRISLKSGEKKLKELFQMDRIPKSQRDRLVVVEGDNEIIWVEGFPVQPKYRVSPSAARALEIRLRHETSGEEEPLKGRGKKVEK
jgi:tRNA(Ile)-lysidine synthase